MKSIYLTLTIFLLSVNLLYAQVFFVSTSGNDNNTGASWNSPFKSIQKALSLANPGSMIFVARGTYYPDNGFGATALDRNASFVLKNGVSLYGGFDPQFGIVDLNSVRTARSTLNGDLLNNDIFAAGNNVENAFHVVTALGVGELSIVDGFNIVNGNANGVGTNGYGGGLFNTSSSYTLKNCRIQGNYATQGGGMHNYSSANLVISGCLFYDNTAGDGGGMYNNTSSPIISNCAFDVNTATNSGGGISNHLSPAQIKNSSFWQNSAKWGAGLANSSSSASVINCLFMANAASINGGGVYNLSASPQIINSTFSGNAAVVSGGAMYNYYTSSPVIKNCIAWNNTAPASPEIGNGDSNDNPQVTYSIIKGGYAGTGNKNEDPQFISGTDFRLQACSPAIDAGSNAALPAGINTDLDANARITHSVVDMGSFEYNGVLYTYYLDADGDGEGNPFLSIESFCTVAPAGYVDNSYDDCDEPGGCVSCVVDVVYRDFDNDGYGDAGNPWYNAPCSFYGPGTGWSYNADDCNDNNANIHPGVAEICGNGIDDNCNGQTDENCETCGQFSNLSTTDITLTSATFNWEAQINPEQWQVQYKSTAPGSKWVDVTGVLPAHRSVTVTGLRGNQNYMWHIRAKCNGTGWTKYSNSVPFVTVVNNLIAGKPMPGIASDENEAALGVFPNPTTGSFVISLDLGEVTEGPVSIRLFDISGKMVQATTVNVINHRLYKTMQMPASAARGMYQVQIRMADKTYKAMLIYK